MTIIENRWVHPEKKEKCKVFFHYESNGSKPYVTFSGYNPFPFFADKVSNRRIYTSKYVFNSWMIENGWKQDVTYSNVFSHVVILEE